MQKKKFGQLTEIVEGMLTQFRRQINISIRGKDRRLKPILLVITKDLKKKVDYNNAQDLHIKYEVLTLLARS